jgi:hypothetical protein
VGGGALKPCGQRGFVDNQRDRADFGKAGDKAGSIRRLRPSGASGREPQEAAVARRVRREHQEAAAVRRDRPRTSGGRRRPARPAKNFRRRRSPNAPGREFQEAAAAFAGPEDEVDEADEVDDVEDEDVVDVEEEDESLDAVDGSDFVAGASPFVLGFSLLAAPERESLR